MTSLSRALDGDIAMAHERLVAAMGDRVPNLPLETKERYFAVLSILVGKLELPEKGLGEILREMMVEVASHLIDQMGSD
jgi:hypothetical protein